MMTWQRSSSPSLCMSLWHIGQQRMQRHEKPLPIRIRQQSPHVRVAQQIIAPRCTHAHAGKLQQRGSAALRGVPCQIWLGRPQWLGCKGCRSALDAVRLRCERSMMALVGERQALRVAGDVHGALQCMKPPSVDCWQILWLLGDSSGRILSHYKPITSCKQPENPRRRRACA
jgi:hypothetical protein